MLFVQFWIKSTRDIWKFCQIGVAPAARPILEKFPNVTRSISGLSKQAGGRRSSGGCYEVYRRLLLFWYFDNF